MVVTDYETRRNEVLAATVEQYLNNAVPVGSSTLSKSGRFKYSSATLRNVLADLEDMGYLTHPHTSAGRIPTDKGYRYYLDFVIGKPQLTFEESTYIRQICEYRLKTFDNILEEASRLISELTHYASLVYLGSPESKFSFRGMKYILEQPEFNDIIKARAIFRLMEEDRNLLELIEREFEGSSKVYIGKESEFDEIKDCSLVVSKAGSKKRKKDRLAVLGPKRMAYKKVIPLVDYLSQLFDEIC